MRYYLYTPPDYRHTDKHLRLVMTLIAQVAALGKAEPLISTAARQEI